MGNKTDHSNALRWRQAGGEGMEYITETIKISENCTVTIRRPILTDSERQKVEKSVVTALERYGRAIRA